MAVAAIENIIVFGRRQVGLSDRCETQIEDNVVKVEVAETALAAFSAFTALATFSTDA